MQARIITVPLWDDERPHLAHGDNWIAYYEQARPGDVKSGTGNTEAQAIAALLARYPMERAA
jgi:hypothetical protein